MTLAEDRAAMPSVHQIISADPGPAAPAPLLESSPKSFGVENIPIERYTSPEFLQREYERVWYRVWQWACREEDIPEVGDHVVYEIGKRSILVVRSAPDRIQAFHNVCLHRARRLKDTDGNSQALTCGFHNWSWNLDGSLAKVPCRWDFPQVRDEDYALPEVRLDTWQGFVFVNLDPDCAPLADSLDVLPAHIGEHFSLEDRFTVANVSKVLPINWKAGQEAFLESYHILATHTNIIEWTGDANSQYDIWDNVSRMITPQGVPSPHIGEFVEEEDTYNTAMEYLAGAMGREAPALPEGVPPRAALAEFVRESMAGTLGVDLSGKSVSEIWDSIEYYLFPNWPFFVGVTTSFHYRFRPNGNDPDTCLFDIRWLMPVPPGGGRPPAAKPHRLGPDEPFSAAPELAAFGGVLDQDMGNLGAIQIGMHASVRDGITVSDYQESRIRHFHVLLDQWMAE